MKLFTGCLAAGLVVLAGSAQAQVSGHEAGRSPYRAVSDVEAPYVAPPVISGPEYGLRPRYAPGPPGPGLLPSTEVYSVLRDNGFSPLGIPRLRGFVYTIAVIDRGGEDGRLVIDARNGRIIRFVPSYRIGDNYEEQGALGGPSAAPPPQAPALVQAAPRPSKPAAQVASRTVPMPKASPIAAKPASAPVAQAAAPAPKPTEVQAAAAPAETGAIPARPAPQIAPTQDMPNAQGLE
jgi:hypothetical protein